MMAVEGNLFVDEHLKKIIASPEEILL